MHRLISVFALMAMIAGTARAETVFWAGVGFSNYGETIEEQRTNFPFASYLFRCDPCEQGKSIDEVARERLTGKPYKNIDISLDLVGTGQLEGLVISPVIARENIIQAVDIDPNGSKTYEYAIRFFINLMLFEFKSAEGRYSGSMPFILKHVETSKKPLSQEELRQIGIDLYVNNKRGMNIFDELYKKATSSIKFMPFSEKYPRITAVSLSDEVAGVMDGHVDLKLFANQTGQIFEANLVQQSGGMLIPTLGDNNSQEMETVFADASRKIKLPEPSFSIGLGVERFVYYEKVKGQQKTVCFIVKANVKIDGVFDTIMDSSFVRKKETCGVIRKVEKLTPHFQFPEQLYSLLYEISKQFDGSVEQEFLQRSTPKTIAKTSGEITTATEQLFAAF